MAKCSPKIMKYTGYLHIIALFVAIYGTMKQIQSVRNNEPASIWLSLSLAVMLLLRVPNQICVALNEYHGWYSVAGTLLGAASFLYLTFETHLAHEKRANEQSKEESKEKTQ